MAEPGADKSGPGPPLSRRSIFSFKLASSDAEKKESDYVTDVRKLTILAVTGIVISSRQTRLG